MKNDQLFDAAVAAVRDETIDPKTMAAAQERVLARLSSQVESAVSLESASVTPAAAAVDSHQIHGCEGFRALLPAYLAGALAEPKRVLVEDHTRECVGCRRALTELKRGAPKAAAAVVPAGERRFRGSRLALAAGLAGLAIVSGTLLVRAGILSPKPVASIQSIDGELAMIAAGESSDGGDTGAIRPAVAGESFGGDTGVRAVRTGGNSGAVVTLADGSRVELAERSELSLGRRWDGTVLKLARGSVIVEAAKQRRGHLYVQTGDCEVAVVGTIFSVNAGAKGSRVSVIEGEVRVNQGVELAVLHPGDQFATGRSLGAVPVAQEISWSRNAAEYRERLQALRALGRELDQALASPGARTSTRLLDLAPEGTSVYVALPNLSQSLAQAWSLVQQRAAENPALAGWWNERFPDGTEQEISDAIAELSNFGGELGAEIAVSVELRHGADADEGDVAPLLYATVVDPAGFSAVLDAEIARLNASATSEGTDGDGHGPVLRRIADPAGAVANGHELLVWTTGDLLVASPSVERLAAVAAVVASGANPFTATPFHSRLAAVYGEGTDWLLGVDLASVVAGHTASSEDPQQDAVILDRLGFADVDQLVIDRRDGDGSDPADAGQNRAVLSFRGERHGIASWLAAPAPLGALEFVSPAAHVAVAGILKNPAEMLDDALAVAAADEGEAQVGSEIAEIEARLGISFRQDLAASLGGDFAFAFDGPWLPTPSWKIVLEVTDAARLHATVQALVEAWNEEASNSEQPRPAIRLTQESVDGRLVFTLALEGPNGVTPVAHALLADGYLLVGPSRALLLEAVSQRAAGVQLASSQAFLDLVPRDGRAHVSALAWQNLGGSIGALGEMLHRLPGANSTAPGTGPEATLLSELAADSGPGLAVAYADGSAISFVTRGLRGPLGLSFESLLAIGGLMREHDDDDAGDVDGSTGSDGSDGSATEQVAPAPTRTETRTRKAA